MPSVLITGAGRGIGRRLALGFAKARYCVGLFSRTRADLAETGRLIRESGGDVWITPGDIRRFDDISNAVAAVTSAFGSVDVLINAAGIQGPIGELDAAPSDALFNTIETNLWGTINACRAVIHQMQRQRHGKIILLSGGGAASPRPNFTAYAATKAAVVRLAECLAAELKDWHIQVNAMAPGASNTGMLQEVLDAGVHVAGRTECRDAMAVFATGGTPAEKQIALALYLASPDSDHVTGRLIHVNDDRSMLAPGILRPEAYTLRRMGA